LGSDAKVKARRDARISAANRPILNALAQRYTVPLSRYFERRVGQKSDAADLVQEVFVRLSRLADLSTIEKPDQYIFATAANALRDRGRRDAVRRQHSHGELDEAEHISSEISPERVLVGREAVARLHQALRQLPERTRDIFVLRVFEDEKLKDVAQKIGISQRAVEKHYAKALTHVSAALRDFRDD